MLDSGQGGLYPFSEVAASPCSTPAANHDSRTIFEKYRDFDLRSCARPGHQARDQERAAADLSTAS